MRAMMKTACGLDDRFLRFDVASYLRNALAGPLAAHDPARVLATHPVLPIRARALLWFDGFRKAHADGYSASAAADFEKVDDRVQADLAVYGEREVEGTRRGMEAEVEQWTWLASAVSSGKLSKAMQERLSALFGVEFTGKARDFLQGAAPAEAIEWLSDNARRAYLSMLEAFPSEATRRLRASLKSSEEAFLAGTPASFIRKEPWFPRE
jgi:hypothetical protein